MFRQVSGYNRELCSICQDPDEMVGPGTLKDDIRVACRCCFHAKCLISYLKEAQGNKQQFVIDDGFKCPNDNPFVGTCASPGEQLVFL